MINLNSDARGGGSAEAADKEPAARGDDFLAGRRRRGRRRWWLVLGGLVVLSGIYWGSYRWWLENRFGKSGAEADFWPCVLYAPAIWVEHRVTERRTWKYVDGDWEGTLYVPGNAGTLEAGVYRARLESGGEEKKGRQSGDDGGRRVFCFIQSMGGDGVAVPASNFSVGASSSALPAPPVPPAWVRDPFALPPVRAPSPESVRQFTGHPAAGTQPGAEALAAAAAEGAEAVTQAATDYRESVTRPRLDGYSVGRISNYAQRMAHRITLGEADRYIRDIRLEPAHEAPSSAGARGGKITSTRSLSLHPRPPGSVFTDPFMLSHPQLRKTLDEDRLIIQSRVTQRTASGTIEWAEWVLMLKRATGVTAHHKEKQPAD